MKSNQSDQADQRQYFRDAGETTFLDYGIHGVNPGARGDQKVRCPACYETHTHQTGQRDLSVNVDKNLYHCHRCEFRGAVGFRKLVCPNCGNPHDRDPDHRPPFTCPSCQFRGQVDGETSPGDRPALRITPSGSPSSTQRAPAIVPLDRDRVRPSAPDAELYEYMASRGISARVVDDNRLTATMKSFEKIGDGWAPKEWCVCFNYYHGDDLVNVKYRSRSKKFGQTPGGSPIPYRMNALRGSNLAIITEGEIDALSFVEAGLPYAVSTPHGAIQVGDKNADGKMKFLELAFEDFEDKDRIYIAVDADEHGERTATEYARRLGRERCLRVEYPAGCKDANDVLVKWGGEVLAQCIRDARPFPFAGVITIGDQLDGLDRFYAEGIPKTPYCGIDELDLLCQFVPGQLVVVTGVPSHGKSSMMDWIFTNQMAHLKWRVGLFSPENYPHEVHTIRILKQLVGNSFYGSGTARMTKAEMHSARDFVRDKLYFVHPPKFRFTLDSIFEAFAYLVRMYGVRVFGIDPWSTVDNQRPAGVSVSDWTGTVLGRCKAFAQEYDSVMNVVAHPTKMPADIDKVDHVEQVKVPTLYDISGSANWYNFADIGMCVFRERGINGAPDTTHLYVQKVRHDYYGRVGHTEFKFDKLCERFYTGTAPNRTHLLAVERLGDDGTTSTAGWSIDMIEDEPF